jgi:hypothetical protein
MSRPDESHSRPDRPTVLNHCPPCPLIGESASGRAYELAGRPRSYRRT